MGSRVKTQKPVVFIFLAAVFAACLCACGGFDTNTEKSGAISGGAVSGAAVSGSAVKETDKPEEKTGSPQYTFCNDRNLYYREDPDEMTERSLSDGSERNIEVKNIQRIVYVDNAWVYYTKDAEGYDEGDGTTVVYESQVWRAPVDKENRWQVNEKKAEFVLEEKEGFSEPEGVWCDGSYVVYVSDETYQYRQYNIAQKKFEPNDWLEKQDDYMGGIVVCGENVFLCYQEKGLIRKKLDSDEVEIIFEGDVSEMKATQTAVFWSSKSPNSDNYGEVWMYSAAGGKTHLLTGPEIERVLRKEKVGSNCEEFDSHHFFTSGMFVRDRRFYVQIGIRGDEKVEGEHAFCCNMVILSKELDSSGQLCMEKKLTGCLQNPREHQKVFSKFLSRGGRGTSEYIYRSRGLCMCMTEDICLMYVENTKKKKNMWGCYDFTAGRFRYITKKDKEWYLMYYARHNTMSMGPLREDPLDMQEWMIVMPHLPNNYDA